MKISVITVCFNSAATLEETLESVAAQTYPNVEHIIIDGASTDNTAEIIHRHEDRISKYISEPDNGIYDAMNKGLSMATGDIIGILNSDDLYTGIHVLSNIAESFTPEIDCVCTDVEIFSGERHKVTRYYSCTRWKRWMFRLGHQPPHPGFFVRKSCYDKYGKFNTGYKLGADFDMMFRLIQVHRCPTLFLPWVSVSMREGGASQNSLKNIARANREVHLSLKNNGYFSSLILVWLKYPLKIFQFFLR